MTLTTAPAASLAWVQRDGYRVAPITVPTNGRSGFSLLEPAQTGVWFTNHLSYERALTNQNMLNGSGVAAGDFDGDGLCDFYFCNLEGSGALFRNLGGWKFQDVTAAAGAGCAHQASRGAAFADVNADGRPDLIVTSVLGPNACLINDGQGHFTDTTQEAGLTLPNAGCSSFALGDVDGDGDLDLYIANNGDNSILRSGGQVSFRMVNGKPVVSGRQAQRLRIVNGMLVEAGPPDAFYLNDGKGHFTAASWTDGMFLDEEGKPLKQVPRDLGLSVIMRDLNQDGFPDIYVCNDFQTPDRIWINDGRGHFRALPDLAIRTTPHFSMAVDVGDFDRDGYDDILLSDMLSRFHRLRLTQIGATNPLVEHVGEPTDRHQARRNVLLWNRGDGTYADIANFARLDASDWTWTMAFLDVDLDGFEEALITNGHAYDTQDMDTIEKAPPMKDRSASSMRGGKNLDEFPSLHTPNYLFRNRGNRTFEEVGAEWGFDSTNVCHGLALGDLDNDGDLDVVVNCLWAAPLVYRNESGAPRVAVRLRGTAPNTAGIGARITVRGGAVPVQSQEIPCGGRYLSSDQPMRVFAAGSTSAKLTIEVAWRTGLRSVIKDALPNHYYEVDEKGAKPGAPRTVPSAIQPFFQDVSERLNHVHPESVFNDLERQPLLHRMFSRLGPGVACFDLDGDGHEDLVIGAGRGGKLGVFRGDGKGGFTKWEGADLWGIMNMFDDAVGIVGLTLAANTRALLVGVARYERADSLSSGVLHFCPAPIAMKYFPAHPTSDSPGPLAVADIDGDGDLDVFVGGRVIAGHYPEAASSAIYRNNGSGLELDSANSALLTKVGLVSGAVFSDLDGDGFPELVLACEWGPIRVLLNAGGKFRDATAELGLASHLGWWNSVTTGDFDGDGRQDILAGNWGLNSSYHQPTPTAPLRLFYGDFDGNTMVDLLEAYTDPATGTVVPRRDLAFLSAGLPLLRTRFANHHAFALADAATVLGDSAGSAKMVQASTLASMLFLNRGGRFDAVPLPDEAQFAPAFGLNVADFDGDGHEDVFLSQNFFAMRLEEPRLDAGRGLWLRGDGTGKLTPVPGQESGVRIYGDQRGSAVADLDEDGRIDLIVAQNGATTKLFHNERAKPGLRIRLSGPPGNPQGIGAVVRIVSGGKSGPAREVHGGSGYWSQDGAVQVMAAPVTPVSIAVRWPGGKTTTGAIPDGAREIAVDLQGGVKALR